MSFDLMEPTDHERPTVSVGTSRFVDVEVMGGQGILQQLAGNHNRKHNTNWQ